MVGVRTAVPIPEQPVRSDAIVVGTLGGGRDRQRQTQDPRREDSLGIDQRDAGTIQQEPRSEHFPRQYVAAHAHGLGHPVKSGRPDTSIVVWVEYALSHGPPTSPERAGASVSPHRRSAPHPPPPSSRHRLAR